MYDLPCPVTATWSSPKSVYQNQAPVLRPISELQRRSASADSCKQCRLGNPPFLHSELVAVRWGLSSIGAKVSSMQSQELAFPSRNEPVLVLVIPICFGETRCPIYTMRLHKNPLVRNSLAPLKTHVASRLPFSTASPTTVRQTGWSPSHKLM